MNLDTAERFVRDLDCVCAPIKSHLNIDTLLQDLHNVSKKLQPDRDIVEKVSDQDYSELVRLFETMRSEATQNLEGGTDWYQHLPTNDPLRCRISLFGTIDLGLRETAHTRTLAWLMDPDAAHGFQDALLLTFLRFLFVEMPSDPHLSDVRIECEAMGGGSRNRLDIFMRGKWKKPDKPAEKWLVIVEAKIEADEGEDQCARYEDDFQEEIASSSHHALVFLTPDSGRLPTTESQRVGSEWIPISFIRLMAQFRTKLSELAGKPGLEFLRLYMTGVLMDLYGLHCGCITLKDDIYRIREYLESEFTGG